MILNTVFCWNVCENEKPVDPAQDNRFLLSFDPSLPPCGGKGMVCLGQLWEAKFLLWSQNIFNLSNIFLKYVSQHATDRSDYNVYYKQYHNNRLYGWKTEIKEKNSNHNCRINCALLFAFLESVINWQNTGHHCKDKKKIVYVLLLKICLCFTHDDLFVS